LAAAPPTATELDSYREEADRLEAELMEEWYLHYAGHKQALELEPIYERHARLVELDRVRAVGGAAGDERTRFLWRWASENYLTNVTKRQLERVATLEAELEAEVDGERIPFRMLAPTTAKEPDRDRRRRLYDAAAELREEHLNPLLLVAARAHRQATPQLGVEDYVNLYEQVGFELERLAGDCRELLEATERAWEEGADRLFRARAGVGLDEAEAWDTPRLLRAEEWDTDFPGDRMLPALRATLGDLGIQLDAQKNVHLDVEQRPKKSPRAFCAPIEVPGRVMLVIQPIGGFDDWRALFHEAGHTEHFAHTDGSLPVEARRMGDAAVTEGWATLFEGLVREPAWLERRLDVSRPRQLAAEGGVIELFFTRRYCAKLLYELEYYRAADPTEMRSRYVELLGDALKIEPSSASYLADIDPGLYVTEYLRSWAFEAQLRDHLRTEFGNAWFARREAGELLRELWSEGQTRRADDMLEELTGSRIEMAALEERIREALALA
jgi:oligoendopeptidase F